jgi:ATP-binding cassette subfamily B (MDR/TAP) protein 1
LDNIIHGLVATKWQHEPRQKQIHRAIDAAKLAFAHDFIMQFPNGYNTRVEREADYSLVARRRGLILLAV